jgi:SAM-dependent methyltransferase
MILGVTPELATLDWPPGTTLVAVDSCTAMIEEVWPRSGLPENARVLNADWRNIPVDAGAFDIVVGDGCLVLLDYPNGYRDLAVEVRRVLAVDGRWVLRIFTRPAELETIESIKADLAEGRVGSFGAFKWRLAAALQQAVEYGVRLAEVWEAWQEIRAGLAMLPPEWTPEIITTIDAYQDSSTKYTFPSLIDVREVLRDLFVEIGCAVPAYELGERCPTLVLAPH